MINTNEGNGPERYVKLRMTDSAHSATLVYAKERGNTVQGLFEPVVRAIANKRSTPDVIKTVAQAMGKTVEQIKKELK